MTTPRRQRLAAGHICFLLFMVALTVQGGEMTSYEIRGRVLDPSGAVISGARVNLFRQGQTPVATVGTNEFGEFHLTQVAAGSYELVAQAPGMEAQRRAGNGA